MLVLTRRISEQLVIGENVVITIVRVDGGQVRIGIEAPAEVPIYRHEIWDAVTEENRAAARTNIKDLPSAKAPPRS